MSLLQDHKLQKNYDLFITSAGFEDRTMSGLEQIMNKTSIKNTIINFYQPEETDLRKKNNEHLEQMKALLTKICTDESIVVENKPDNSNRFHDIIDAYIGNTSTVLIDITSFTRLFLYSMLSSCLKYNVHVDVLYSEPLNYTMNFSQGLEKIIILPEYPGIPDQSKKILMIMFLGWESRRAESVVEEFDPEKLITFLEVSNDRQRAYWNSITLKQCTKLRDNSEFHEVRALEPESTLKKLEEIYEKYHKSYDICIVNIGPKSQCLAISQFANNHDEVQVLYPKPYKWTQEYSSNENTSPLSTGKGKTYLLKFPLS